MIKFLREITLLRTRGARQKSTSFGNELLKIYLIEGNMQIRKFKKVQNHSILVGVCVSVCG